LVVDADAVLAFAVTAQGLQRVAGQGREVLQARGGFQPVEPFSACRAKPENSLTRSPLAKRSVWHPGSSRSFVKK